MITLTREEAQRVLDALEEIYWPKEHQAHKEIETLRARLSAPECVCGEPNTAGVHRQDGPCYQQPEPSIVEDAIVYGTGITMGGKRIDPASIYKEPEPPCKTGSQCIGGKCPQCVVPEPVGWIYEDDEGRMMFSQMPTSGLFWEPVYREKNNKGIE